MIQPPRCSSSPSIAPSAIKLSLPSSSNSGDMPSAVETSACRPILTPSKRSQGGAKTEAYMPCNTCRLLSRISVMSFLRQKAKPWMENVPGFWRGRANRNAAVMSMVTNMRRALAGMASRKKKPKASRGDSSASNTSTVCASTQSMSMKAGNVGRKEQHGHHDGGQPEPGRLQPVPHRADHGRRRQFYRALAGGLRRGAIPDFTIGNRAPGGQGGLARTSGRVRRWRCRFP